MTGRQTPQRWTIELLTEKPWLATARIAGPDTGPVEVVRASLLDDATRALEEAAEEFARCAAFEARDDTAAEVMQASADRFRSCLARLRQEASE